MNIGIMIVGLGILTVLSILVYRTNKEQDETCEADAQPKRDLYKEAQTEMAVNPYANEKTQSLLIDTLKEMGGTIRGINKEDLRPQFGIRKLFKKLVIRDSFCTFVSDYQLLTNQHKNESHDYRRQNY